MANKNKPFIDLNQMKRMILIERIKYVTHEINLNEKKTHTQDQNRKSKYKMK